MKIAVLRERVENERRVAVVPHTVKAFTALGMSVFVERGAGADAGFSDDEYKACGAAISAVPLEIIGDADLILKVQPSPIDSPVSELELGRRDSIIIGLLAPYSNHELFEKYQNKGIIAFAMELIPRLSKTQSLDALSFQAMISGYRAVIEAIYYYEQVPSMTITAAGTLAAAKVVVLGAGVAGLQAIATARRLGAVVFGYDKRVDAQEQITSLGAKVIDSADELGHHISSSNIIITSAQIQGQKAPILITNEMIMSMKRGSIVVDMAVLSGGNVSATVKDKVVDLHGVKIIGHTNLASRVAKDASKLYSNNMYNFVKYIASHDINDDIIKATLVTRGFHGIDKL